MTADRTLEARGVRLGYGDRIIVHAKMTIIDDKLLRIGSSNLNNRSMGLDSECDLTIEVREDDGRRATEAALSFYGQVLGFSPLDVPVLELRTTA